MYAFKYLHIITMFLAVASSLGPAFLLHSLAQSGEVRTIRSGFRAGKPLIALAPILFDEGVNPMKLSYLMVVSAVVALSFGIAAVLAAGSVASFYGATLNPAGTIIAQLFGATLIGFAVLNWLAKNAKEGEALRAIVLANLVGDTIGFIVALLGQLSGALNAFGWAGVVINLILALGFLYYQLGFAYYHKKPGAS